MTFPLPLARPLARSPARPRRPQRVGKYMRQLRELIPQDQVDSSRIKVSNQKRAGGSASSSKMAGAASPADEPAPDLSDFADELRETGAKMTVAQLKSALKLMGEKTSGKKDELLERVVAWLEERGLWAEEAGPSKGGKGGKKWRGATRRWALATTAMMRSRRPSPTTTRRRRSASWWTMKTTGDGGRSCCCAWSLGSCRSRPRSALVCVL